MNKQEPVYHPRPGDTVVIIGCEERYGVVDVHFPLVTLRSQTGKQFQAGWRALELVERAA